MTSQKSLELERYPLRKSILTPFDEDGGAAAAVPSLLEQMPIACCLGAESIPPAESGSKECPSHDGPRIFGLLFFGSSRAHRIFGRFSGWYCISAL